MRRGRCLAVALVLAVTASIAACGGGSPDSTKYKQTWTKGYDLTTCSDWLNVMDDHQRFVGAGDILVAVRKKDGGNDLPSDDLIRGFAVDVSDMCAAPAGQVASSILEIGPLVYVAFRDKYRP